MVGETGNGKRNEKSNSVMSIGEEIGEAMKNTKKLRTYTKIGSCEGIEIRNRFKATYD